MSIILQFLFFLFLPPVFLLWKIGDFYIRAITFMFKAFFGIVAWLLKLITGGALWPERVIRIFYKQGVHNLKKKDATSAEGEGRILSTLTQYKLRYILVFVAALWLFPGIGLQAFLRDLPTGISQIGILEVIQLFFRLVFVFLPLIVVFMVSAISYEILNDGVFFVHTKKALEQAKHWGSDAASKAADTAASAAGNGDRRPPQQGRGAELGESALTTASHVETAADTVGAEEGLGGLLEGSMFEGAAGAAGSVAIILVVAFAFYMLVAVAITGVLLAMTWVYLSQFIPVVAGPLLGALGLGEAYASYFGTEIANSEVGVAARSGNLLPPEFGRSISQATARLGCIAEGPQCMREWRLNNTVRPGSESRGERYELYIDQFGLGTGDTIDVAYKEADYTIPVNFLVSNTRNGLKGIPARNVSYKISVKDFDKTYCSTGWREISSFGDSGRDVILPGLGVSPTDSLQDLNLGDCELLQPSLGVDRVMELQVKYQYSSQATLYVDAMSRQHRREQGIEPGFRKSETANTPVQSYINVKEPITFYETETGDRKAVPFSARFGFSTPGADVKYKVNPDSIEIVDSSLTNNTDTCVGLNGTDRENYYSISDNAETRIELRQNDSFFNSQDEPAPLRCTMKLRDDALDRISPTGEELIMRIDGNYTIVKQDEMRGFDVRNTLCSRNNCPLLVTEEYNETHTHNLSSTCTTGDTVDARDGCGLRNPDQGDAGWRVPNIVRVDGEPVTIPRGKTAKKASNLLNEAGKLEDTYGGVGLVASKSSNLLVDPEDAVGAPNPSRSQLRSKGLIYYQTSDSPGNIQVERLRVRMCEENTQMSDVSTLEEAGEKYIGIWKENNRGSPVKIGMAAQSCQSSLERRPEYQSEFGGSISSMVNACDGVVVSISGTARCYGGQFN